MIALHVWVPVPIQAAESCCSQWLVHRRVILQPGKFFSYLFGVCRQAIFKIPVEEIYIAWTASVVYQSGYGSYTFLFHAIQAFLCKRPVYLLPIIRLMTFPQNRVTQHLYA